MPIEAAEDWITAVNSAPAITPNSGFLKLVISWINSGSSRRGSIASLIIPIPIKITPTPATMPPMCCNFLFFTKTTSTTPINAISGAKAPTSNAISCPVMVVPILAPIMIHTAWLSDIRPEFTKPTVITVVAEDDWISAVMPAPTRIPIKRLVVSFSRICFILFPAAASRLLLIICIPYRNSARPPRRPKSNSTPIFYSFFLMNRVFLHYLYIDNICFFLFFT